MTITTNIPFYGLRVTREETAHTVWVSTDQAKLESHKKFINEVVDVVPPFAQMEQVEGHVIVDHIGWYHLSNMVRVYIDKFDDRECIGSVYRVFSGKVKPTPFSRRSWYLNGVPHHSGRLAIQHAL